MSWSQAADSPVGKGPRSADLVSQERMTRSTVVSTRVLHSSARGPVSVLYQEASEKPVALPPRRRLCQTFLALQKEENQLFVGEEQTKGLSVFVTVNGLKELLKPRFRRYYTSWGHTLSEAHLSSNLLNLFLYVPERKQFPFHPSLLNIKAK